MRHFCQISFESCAENGQQATTTNKQNKKRRRKKKRKRKRSQRSAYHSGKPANREISKCTLTARSPKTSQGGASLSSCQTRCGHHSCRQCSLFGLNLQLDKPSPMPSAGLLKWLQSDHTCCHPHRVNEFATGSEKLNGNGMHMRRWSTPTLELLRVYCPGHAGVKGNDRADRLTGKATITSSLRLGRSKLLRRLRQHLRAQSRGHHTIDRLEERGVERGNARRSFLKGRESVIVNQKNIGTVSKATLRKRLRDRTERI